MEQWLPDLKLTDADRQVLLNPLSWLTDNLINAAQQLLRKVFIAISRFEDVACGEALSFEVELSEFIQILNNRSGYWLTVSTIGC